MAAGAGSLDRQLAGLFCRAAGAAGFECAEARPSEIAALVTELGTRGIRIYAIELEGASLGPELPPLLVGAKEATTDGLLPGRKGGQEVSGREGQAEGRAPDHRMEARTDAASVVRGKAGASKTDESEPQVSHYDSGTLMIKAPIRSGQAIMHPHGDVIVLGSVASGSEIVAAGSIHVYGTLRGRASAGALGNTSARIFCRRNEGRASVGRRLVHHRRGDGRGVARQTGAGLPRRRGPARRDTELMRLT